METQEPDLQILLQFTDEQIEAEYHRRLLEQTNKLLAELQQTLEQDEQLSQQPMP